MGRKMAHLVADLGCNKGQLTLFVKLFLSGFQKKLQRNHYLHGTFLYLCTLNAKM